MPECLHALHQPCVACGWGIRERVVAVIVVCRSGVRQRRVLGGDERNLNDASYSSHHQDVTKDCMYLGES